MTVAPAEEATQTQGQVESGEDLMLWSSVPANAFSDAPPPCDIVDAPLSGIMDAAPPYDMIDPLPSYAIATMPVSQGPLWDVPQPSLEPAGVLHAPPPDAALIDPMLEGLDQFLSWSAPASFDTGQLPSAAVSLSLSCDGRLEQQQPLGPQPTGYGTTSLPSLEGVGAAPAPSVRRSKREKKATATLDTSSPTVCPSHTYSSSYSCSPTTTNTTSTSSSSTRHDTSASPLSSWDSISPPSGPSSSSFSSLSSQKKNKRNSRNGREANRIAAAKCRSKTKTKTSRLQECERELRQQNQVLTARVQELRNEVLHIKNEILRHGNCDSDVIKAYIARTAREIK